MIGRNRLCVVIRIVSYASMVKAQGFHPCLVQVTQEWEFDRTDEDSAAPLGADSFESCRVAGLPAGYGGIASLRQAGGRCRAATRRFRRVWKVGVLKSTRLAYLQSPPAVPAHRSKCPRLMGPPMDIVALACCCHDCSWHAVQRRVKHASTPLSMCDCLQQCCALGERSAGSELSRNVREMKKWQFFFLPCQSPAAKQECAGQLGVVQRCQLRALTHAADIDHFDCEVH